MKFHVTNAITIIRNRTWNVEYRQLRHNNIQLFITDQTPIWLVKYINIAPFVVWEIIVIFVHALIAVVIDSESDFVDSE